MSFLFFLFSQVTPRLLSRPTVPDALGPSTVGRPSLDLSHTRLRTFLAFGVLCPPFRPICETNPLPCPFPKTASRSQRSFSRLSIRRCIPMQTTPFSSWPSRFLPLDECGVCLSHITLFPINAGGPVLSDLPPALKSFFFGFPLPILTSFSFFHQVLSF